LVMAVLGTEVLHFPGVDSHTHKSPINPMETTLQILLSIAILVMVCVTIRYAIPLR